MNNEEFLKQAYEAGDVLAEFLDEQETGKVIGADDELYGLAVMFATLTIWKQVEPLSEFMQEIAVEAYSSMHERIVMTMLVAMALGYLKAKGVKLPEGAVPGFLRSELELEQMLREVFEHD